MLIYVEEKELRVDFNVNILMNILDDIYDLEHPVFLKFHEDLCKPDGTKVRGGYSRGVLPMQKGLAPMHLIYIDSGCDLETSATVLLHEYAHLLSQQDHGFLMYELWREYLREEFQRRWYNAIGKEDWETDRGRTIMVGEVCRDGEDKCLQE
jgi:hypothetical protein